KRQEPEPEQPPRPEPQELGPLNGDTAITVQLCASEEAEQHQKDITRILQQHEEEKKKWAQQSSGPHMNRRKKRLPTLSRRPVLPSRRP
ncbi:CCDC69 isoform 5, partial [Pongo abelii]